ncbi:rhamnan synthesis F family protein [Pseudoclavibacter helvolus]|uniref:rhamnan synthesis F family protein n=1 Tax=Pseudoclavibacter helvolus TaxID=255205 RepID=UPI003736C9CD
MKLSDLTSPKRLGIFFFFDEQGVVDDYVTTLLDGMQPHLDHVIVVVNGELNEAGRALFLARPGTDLIERPNEGFDSWAYKTAIDSIGWEGLAEYDEFVMFNFTIVGPVADMGLMFDTMDAKDLDFWGVTVHHAAPFDPFGVLETPTLPVHIQSHFIAVRRSMFLSEPFQDYWDDLPPIPDYSHAVAKHEAKFTWFFDRLGFTWEVYVDTTDLEPYTLYPLNTYPVELIEERNCPIFKRKTLFAGIPSTIEEFAGFNATRLYEFLESSGRFDMAQLRPHMQRSMDQYAQFSTLHDWVMLEPAAPHAESFAVLVPVGASFDERLAQARLIAGADALVVTGTRSRLQDVQSAVREAGATPVEVTSHWSEAASKIEPGVTVVLAPDAFHQSGRLADLVDARAFGAETFGLPDPSSAIAEFARAPELGLLVAAPLLHGEHYGDLGREWDDTTPAFEGIAAMLGIAVPYSRKSAPLQGSGGTVILRTEAVRAFGAAVAAAPYGSLVQLSTRDWQKLVALAVQTAGFVPRVAVTPTLAKYLLSMTFDLLRRINRAVGPSGGARASTLIARVEPLS